MTKPTKYALGLLVWVFLVTGCVILMSSISDNKELSCIVSCGLIAIGLLAGIFFLCMEAAERGGVIESNLADHAEEPLKSRSVIPIRKQKK